MVGKYSIWGCAIANDYLQGEYILAAIKDLFHN
jgi:hypothetical protein